MQISERLYTDQVFGNTSTVYHTGGIVDQGLTCITLELGLAMLIGPPWLLQHLVTTQSSPGILLGVISGMSILFTVLAAFFTLAKPSEILAATAAYAFIRMLPACFGKHAIGSSTG